MCIRSCAFVKFAYKQHTAWCACIRTMQAGQNLVVGSLPITDFTSNQLKEGAWIVRKGDKFFIGTSSNWSDADEVTGVLMSTTPTAISSKVTVCYRGAVDAQTPPGLTIDTLKPGNRLSHGTHEYGRVVHRILLPSIRGNPNFNKHMLRVYVKPTCNSAVATAVNFTTSFATPAPPAALPTPAPVPMAPAFVERLGTPEPTTVKPVPHLARINTPVNLSASLAPAATSPVSVTAPGGKQRKRVKKSKP